MTLTLPLFANFFGVMPELCLGACMPNLKFEPETILGLLAFKPQKLGVT